MTDHESILDAIAGISRLSTEIVELEAVWLERPLQMEGKRSIRIAKGDRVAVMNMGDECHLMDCSSLVTATHIVTACRGTIYSTLLAVEVRDLKTNELLTIKL